ncbi:DNA-binding response regulator [Paenibacillus glycanilyticus]|uniref:DNA-binding response regulator n=1 Tax=Paenibacillus glycanilyticus TaxID=126569 RepID=UPI002040C2C6|nr:DNA-binding response regulator [Paenibacillus glycanilyticus]MCM3628100.1 DNA-binding response regulator [Paenibacillus glycanilyticus]
MFEAHYEPWLQSQLASSGGERKRRLTEVRHAENLFLEKVWCPAVGHLEHLHAEYEVNDYKDGQRFLDYAYLRDPYKICFEIDGYGPHHRDADRRQFADNLMRQNHLILDDWIVIRFSYDDVKSKPRQCQQFIQQLFGKLYSLTTDTNLSLQHKEILRYITIKQSHISPQEVKELLKVGNKAARSRLHELVEKKFLISASSGSSRVRYYALSSQHRHQ